MAKTEFDYWKTQINHDADNLEKHHTRLLDRPLTESEKEELLDDLMYAYQDIRRMTLAFQNPRVAEEYRPNE